MRHYYKGITSKRTEKILGSMMILDVLISEDVSKGNVNLVMNCCKI